jgi:hypothetical protein
MTASASPITRPAPAAAGRCVTCGQPLDTPYCPHCGERRAGDRSYSLFHFTKENVVDAVGNLDGRVIRSLKRLLGRPGQLTVEFMQGVRLPYIAPLQLFLTLNVAFFVWSSAEKFSILDTQLAVQTKLMPWHATASRMMHERMVGARKDSVSFTASFDAVGHEQAKTLVILMVPMLAVGLAALMIGRGQSVVKHIVFSLHFYAFTFVAIPITIELIIQTNRWILGPLHAAFSNAVVTEVWNYTFTATLGVYLTLALRRAYDVGRARAMLSGVAATFLVGAVFYAYRFILLVAGMHSI